MKNVFKVIFTWVFCASMFLAVAKIDYAQTSDDHYAQTIPDHKTVVPQGGPSATLPNGLIQGQHTKPSTGPVVHSNQDKIPVTLTIDDLALVILYTESDEHAEEILKSLPDDVLKEVVQAMLEYDLKLQKKVLEENRPKSRI